ncbi:MAG TPA: MBL fold metallo-hydrolase [Actinomycetota bacterium]|nr:MBL fold metallo-hydrolase [Actinomycetota bacterium]
MDVTVLGSSAMYATRDVPATGYIVTLDGFRLWMDAGGGTWQRLLSLIDYRDVDGILLSHRHPDHTIDVFQAFHARAYGVYGALPPIPLWAPAETVDRITTFSPELREVFEINLIAAGDTVDIGGTKTTFFEMAHPAETCGVRIESGSEVLSYTADTGPAADLHGLARDADLFISEATFQDRDQPWWEGHMSATLAGRAARESGVRRLMLSHLPEGRDLETSLSEARLAAGDIEVVLAEAGTTTQVGSR